MNILALDLGTKLGWALSVEGQPIVSGVCNFSPQRFEGGGMVYVRFQRFLEEMYRHSFVDEGRFPQVVDLVAYEEVRRHIGCDAAHRYGGLMGTLSKWCEERKIPYTGLPVGAIKKNWTGRGNANKREMLAEAIRRGFTPADDNEADALAILHMAVGQCATE